MPMPDGLASSQAVGNQCPGCRYACWFHRAKMSGLFLNINASRSVKFPLTPLTLV